MSLIDALKRLLGVGQGVDSNGGSGASAMISCEDALRLVHEYLDGELEEVSEAEVQAHFDVCQRCYPHLQLERAYRGAIRRAGAGAGAPSGLREKVAALVSEAESEG